MPWLNIISLMNHIEPETHGLIFASSSLAGVGCPALGLEGGALLAGEALLPQLQVAAQVP